MTYSPKNYDRLIGLQGFSDQLLKNHFTLYQGYVSNANKLAEALAALSKEGKSGTPEYAELTRRFGWEFDGMRLHELYFGNMAEGAAPLDRGSRLARKIAEQFGGVENWEKELKAVASMRGIGWAILSLDAENDRLFNCWINEHDGGHLCGTTPILVLDVFEHAFMIDYGLQRAEYIKAFFKAVDWKAVAKRYDAALASRAVAP